MKSRIKRTKLINYPPGQRSGMGPGGMCCAAEVSDCEELRRHQETSAEGGLSLLTGVAYKGKVNET